MCFSAPASFSASVVLLTVGVIAQRKTTTPKQRIFAAIPFLFGIQQFSEGVLWLSFSYDSFKAFETGAMYTFLFFAQIVWPAFVPLAMLTIETDAKRKRILRFLCVFGGLVSAILLLCLITHAGETRAYAECYHVYYKLYYPIPPKYGGIFYFIPTAIPPFIVSVKKMKLLGAILVVLYIICKIFYITYILSVWCFFASITSIIVLFAVIELNKAQQTSKIGKPDLSN